MLIKIVGVGLVMGLIASAGLYMSSRALFSLVPKYVGDESRVFQSDISYADGTNWYPSGQLQPAIGVQGTVGVE